MAIDAKTARLIWNVPLAARARSRLCDDRRAAGRQRHGDRRRGRWGIRHSRIPRRLRRHTGREVWRFNTIPGRANLETKPGPDDSWEHGGASVWVTGSYDPDLNLTYWGIGNPGPDWNGDQREGDNLYPKRGRARRGHGHAEMALSVHASR